VLREGFPEFEVGDFVDFFCEHMKVKPQDEITRIEWRYLDAAPESDRTGEKDLPRGGRPAGGTQWPS